MVMVKNGPRAGSHLVLQIGINDGLVVADALHKDHGHQAACATLTPAPAPKLSDRIHQIRTIKPEPSNQNHQTRTIKPEPSEILERGRLCGGGGGGHLPST